MVYQPAEDSYLLESAVKKFARGDVLDMGTGTGILALAAKQTPGVTSVVAADVDQEAVARAAEKGLDTVQTDLFNNLPFKFFDTIVCNTPYLPNEEFAEDVALDGGKKGFEWTVEFLQQSRYHMRPKGQLLILISTRTNQGVVEQRALELGYEYELVAQQKIQFETLLVYQLTRAFNDVDIEYLARGKRSMVYEKGDAVFKKCEPVHAHQEASMLKRVNELRIGPKLRFAHENVVVMDKVDGVRLGDFWETASLPDAQVVASNIIAQLRLLDANKIEKQELTNPYKHVIVLDDLNVVLIDWERARMREDPQNVRQFTEHLRRTIKKYPSLNGLENVL